MRCDATVNTVAAKPHSPKRLAERSTPICPVASAPAATHQAAAPAQQASVTPFGCKRSWARLRRSMVAKRQHSVVQPAAPSASPSAASQAEA